MHQITLTIGSEIEELSLVSVALHRILEHLGAGGKVVDEIELCVNEAVANSIHHAYRNAPGQYVSVKILASEKQIECDVFDYGEPMPEEKAKTLTGVPRVDQSFDDKNAQLEEHGRGLKIIAALMDETEYFRDGTANCLRMKKRI
jgi:serine/threonine-protein kinase RsbW